MTRKEKAYYFYLVAYEYLNYPLLWEKYKSFFEYWNHCFNLLKKKGRKQYDRACNIHKEELKKNEYKNKITE